MNQHIKSPNTEQKVIKSLNTEQEDFNILRRSLEIPVDEKIRVIKADAARQVQELRDALSLQLEILQKPLEKRNKQIEEYVISMISHYLTDLFEVETIFSLDDSHNEIEVINVLPGVLDMRISINRSTHPISCSVKAPGYSARFDANHSPDTKGGIFWRPEKYHAVGEEPLNDITTNAINSFIDKYNPNNSYMNMKYGKGELTIHEGEKEGEIVDRFPLSADICAIGIILNTYPYKDKKVRDVFRRYYEYPIMEYRQLVHTFLMIRWFRDSVLSAIPKDVVRLIAKEIWAFRLIKHVAIKEE